MSEKKQRFDEKNVRVNHVEFANEFLEGVEEKDIRKRQKEDVKKRKKK